MEYAYELRVGFFMLYRRYLFISVRYKLSIKVEQSTFNENRNSLHRMHRQYCLSLALRGSIRSSIRLPSGIVGNGSI